MNKQKHYEETSMQFERYRDRNIECRGLLKISGWQIKVYTISHKTNFESDLMLNNIKLSLPKWITDISQSNLPTYRQAFLIVHEAREGVFTLLNWWTGGEMIETRIFFTDYEEPFETTKTPFTQNALVCIWELEVFAHEREAWITDILLKPDRPDFQNYGNNQLVK